MKEAVKRALGQIGLEDQAVSLWRAGKQWVGPGRNRESHNGTLTPLGEAYIRGKGLKKLHIGSGEHTLEGWLNVDILPATDEVMPFDATTVFPFRDSTFDYIFSEHMIEHIPYKDAEAMLGECFRVLRPGGMIRISTPDLASLLRLYSSEKTDLHLRFVDSHCTDWGAPYNSEVFVINDYFRLWGHEFIYDEASLGALLKLSGFSDVTRCNLGVSDHESLQGLEYLARLEPGMLEFISFTLEATKPIHTADLH